MIVDVCKPVNVEMKLVLSSEIENKGPTGGTEEGAVRIHEEITGQGVATRFDQLVTWDPRGVKEDALS